MASEPSSAPPSANQSGASAQEHRVSVAGCTHPNQQHPDHRPSRTPERRGWCGRGLFVRQGHADRRPPVPPARLLTSPQPSVGTRTLTDKRRVAKRTPHTPHRDQPTPHNSASAAAHPHQPGKADEPRLTTSTSNVHTIDGKSESSRFQCKPLHRNIIHVPITDLRLLWRRGAATLRTAVARLQPSHRAHEPPQSLRREDLSVGGPAHAAARRPGRRPYLEASQ